jgi:hypothetical protein
MAQKEVPFCSTQSNLFNLSGLRKKGSIEAYYSNTHNTHILLNTMLLHPFILEIHELAAPNNDDADCSISSSSSSSSCQSLFESWNNDDNPLQLLQDQESDYCIDNVDYLSSASSKENVVVTPADCRVMCNWCYKIAELSSLDN